MTIDDAIRALGNRNVIVSLDIGEHRYCKLESNCPIAIKLRQLISEAGVSLVQLIESFVDVTNSTTINSGFDKPEIVPISSKAEINFLGKRVEFDLAEVLAGSMREAVNKKIKELNLQQTKLEDFGENLYESYQEAVRKLHINKKLPQYIAEVSELVKYGVYITGIRGAGAYAPSRYVFTFNVEYNPLWIVRSGIRLKLNDSDIASIIRPGFLMIEVTTEAKVYSVTLVDKDINVIQHYHGRGNDCWGSVQLKIDTNMSLSSISRLKDICMKSLGTINYDSLMNRCPPGMPDVEVLLRRSTVLGREGEIKPPEEVRPEEPRPTTTWGTRTGWGQTRRE